MDLPTKEGKGGLMLLKRCILIYPEFDNVPIIDNIRNKYDPLARHVKPHITLVFPFESDIDNAVLQGHVSSVVSEFSPFELILNGITPIHTLGKYLFLNVTKGSEEIIELHKRLYTGILKDHFPEWLKTNVFVPHMTVGNFDNDMDFEKATNETKNIEDTFITTANNVSVEIIKENQDSIIELISSVRTNLIGKANRRCQPTLL